MARAGMANLIMEVRKLGRVGTADVTVGATTYWSDDQLQTALDRWVSILRMEPLLAIPVAVAGNYQYLDFAMPDGWYEEAGSDSGFAVKTASGATVSSGYAVNYAARRITFTTDQGAVALYLDARLYDLYRAVADVWQAKAGFAAERVNWSSDNHRIDAGDQHAHCLTMATFFRGKSQAGGLVASKMARRDESWLS